MQLPELKKLYFYHIHLLIAFLSTAASGLD